MKSASPGVYALAQMSCLGPASARMLAEAGVPDPQTLARIGPEEAYRRLRFTFGKRASASYLYALEAAARGCRWRDVGEVRKSHLRKLAHAIAAQQNAVISSNAVRKKTPK